MRSNSYLFACLVAVGFTGACGGEGADVSTGQTQQSALADAARLGASSSMRPVASLTLPNGNVVEFYDMKTGAVVSEFGKAYSAPGLNVPDEGGADELSDIWRKLAPHAPVPAALSQLQERLMNLGPDASGAEPAGESVGSQASALALDPGQGVLAAPNGCDNGCCDYEWLYPTFTECQNTWMPIDWMFYNYGWSYQNRSDIIEYRGFVCAAERVSQYKVSVGSYSINWSIPTPYYRTWGWLAGYSCNPFCGYNKKDLKSSVNTSSNMALHTYCGNINR